MTNWKITGIIATLVVVLSIPAYLVKQKYKTEPMIEAQAAAFVGGNKCA